MTTLLGAAATRRTILGAGLRGAGALAALGGMGLSGCAGADARGDGAKGPLDATRAFMLMRGALDDRLVMGFLVGRYYGVVEGETRPLFGVAAVTFTRYRPHPSGGYEAIGFEVPYFTDLETGRVMDRFHNPYTNETVTVTHGGFPPARVHIGLDGVVRLPEPVPNMVIDHRALPPDVFGDDVWVVEQVATALTIPGQSKPRRYSEQVTFHAPRAALEDPAARQVNATVAYASESSWRAWMNMGDRPGVVIGTGHGRSCVPLDALPEVWREAAAARRPGFLADPGAALAPLWNAKR